MVMSEGGGAVRAFTQGQTVKLVIKAEASKFEMFVNGIGLPGSDSEATVTRRSVTWSSGETWRSISSSTPRGEKFITEYKFKDITMTPQDCYLAYD